MFLNEFSVAQARIARVLTILQMADWQQNVTVSVSFCGPGVVFQGPSSPWQSLAGSDHFPNLEAVASPHLPARILAQQQRSKPV